MALPMPHAEFMRRFAGIDPDSPPEPPQPPPQKLNGFAVPASAALAKHPHMSSISVAAVVYQALTGVFSRPHVLMLRASWPQARKDYSGKWTIPVAAVSESDGTLLEAVARLITNTTGFTANIVEFMGYYEETGVDGGTNRTYTFLATLPKNSPEEPPPPALGPGYRFAAWFNGLRASDNWGNYPCRAIGMFVNEAYGEIDHALLYKRRHFQVRNYKNDREVGLRPGEFSSSGVETGL